MWYQLMGEDSVCWDLLSGPVVSSITIAISHVAISLRRTHVLVLCSHLGITTHAPGLSGCAVLPPLALPSPAPGDPLPPASHTCALVVPFWRSVSLFVVLIISLTFLHTLLCVSDALYVSSTFPRCLQPEGFWGQMSHPTLIGTQIGGSPISIIVFYMIIYIFLRDRERGREGENMQAWAH